MKARLFTTLFVMIALTGCMQMKSIDFMDAKPRFVLEEFFDGQTQASGIFEDRFGNLRREFVVEIKGVWDGETLLLNEDFFYSDGEREQRIWTIEKIDDHTYQGRADDIIGVATGESYGNVLNWRYYMDLKLDDSTIRVHFDDWMYLQPSGVMLNRAKVSKWGIELGTVTLAFTKK
ncbi:DUF3833 domain-containing protein [uncultured Sneathiella sp.]|uniref:DUF3833 domain-containing protein n=1 Tax=uncultured Sneathiella sp. TaxID=879315 RepID=UPI0030D9EAC7